MFVEIIFLSSFLKIIFITTVLCFVIILCTITIIIYIMIINTSRTNNYKDSNAKKNKFFSIE